MRFWSIKRTFKRAVFCIYGMTNTNTLGYCWAFLWQTALVKYRGISKALKSRTNSHSCKNKPLSWSQWQLFRAKFNSSKTGYIFKVVITHYYTLYLLYTCKYIWSCFRESSTKYTTLTSNDKLLKNDDLYWLAILF